MLVYSTFVFLHAALGTIALLAFWTAAVMKKGSPRHRFVGKAFLLAMCGIMLTGFPLVIERLVFRHQPVGALFLAYLLVITGQASWLAWRTITDKHDWRALTQRVGWRVATVLPGLVGTWVMLVGLIQHQPLLMGFSLIGLFTAARMRTFAQRGPQHANWHVVMHYQSMLGCGIATHVAFLSIGMRPAWRWLETHTVVPEMLINLFPWFAPIAIAAMAGVWLNRKWARPMRASAVACTRSVMRESA